MKEHAKFDVLLPLCARGHAVIPVVLFCYPKFRFIYADLKYKQIWEI